MIVRCHGVRGRRSSPQSKYGLMTTDFGMNGALSRSLRRVLGIGEVVREERLVPLPRAVDRLGVRIEQQLRRVAPVPLVGRPRAVHAKAVALPGLHVGQVAVPARAPSSRADRRASRSRHRRTDTARPAGRPRKTPRSWCRRRRRWRPADRACQARPGWRSCRAPDLLAVLPLRQSCCSKPEGCIRRGRALQDAGPRWSRI